MVGPQSPSRPQRPRCISPPASIRARGTCQRLFQQHPLRRLLTVVLLLTVAASVHAQPFHLPTANRALFETGGEDRFFVGTPARTWVSGAFGCVRSEGWRIHEGLDIRCLERDDRDEPIDPILATADGDVVHISRNPSKSNYGIFIVLRHHIEGIEIYSLYAHLRQVSEGLEVGQAVEVGSVLGLMGRTTSSRTPISRERAHLHFELNLLMNEAFPAWFRKQYPTQKNEHGQWNGLNLFALDPRQVFLTQLVHGEQFSLLHVIRSQPELMRVAVRETDFSWRRRYPQLIRPNPRAEEEGIAGYELVFNYNGVAYEMIPRAESELPSNDRIHLVSVVESEYQLRPCRKLVTRQGSQWKLTAAGNRLVDLLLH